MDTITYSIFKPLVWLLVKVLYRPTVIGKENLPKKGAYVLAGNHTKWIDPPTLVALNKKQIHFLAKEEMWHNICLIVVKAMGCIPVNRKIHDHDALEAAYKCLDNGSSIGIFPEGTINRTDDLTMPFKIGAVKMANKCNVPLVPFVITGKYKLFRKGVTIEFLKPRKIGDDIDKENKKLEKDIAKKIKESKSNGK